FAERHRKFGNGLGHQKPPQGIVFGHCNLHLLLDSKYYMGYVRFPVNTRRGAMRIALFEPDIPQNAAAIIRLGACLGVPVDIIEPCGFLFSDAGLRRAGMDYVELADVAHHASWDSFLAGHNGRIVLMTTRAELP